MDQPEGKRLVAFGFAFCVPEAIMDHARSAAPPFLWHWTLSHWRQGRKVWLEKKEARRAQMDGEVSLFAIASADVYRYGGVELGRITNMLSVAAARDLSGYRVRHFAMEASDLEMRDRLASHGLSAVRDYHEFRDDAVLRALPVEQRPFLMYADFKRAAEDTLLQQTSIGRAALAGNPRYGFSGPEQELMKIALAGLTDQAIAEKLGLSLIAIKKRWEGIYDKVSRWTYLQALEKAGPDAVVAKTGRRLVLQMMAEHPEEFRPSPPRRRP
jgi:hypothetical protein